MYFGSKDDVVWLTLKPPPATEWFIANYLRFRFGIPIAAKNTWWLRKDIQEIKDGVVSDKRWSVAKLMRLSHRFLRFGGAVEICYHFYFNWHFLSQLWAYIQICSHLLEDPLGDDCPCWDPEAQQ